MDDKTFLEKRFGFLWTLLVGCVALSLYAIHYYPRRSAHDLYAMSLYGGMQFLIAGLGIACAIVLADRVSEREGKYFFPASGTLLAAAQWYINLTLFREIA